MELFEGMRLRRIAFVRRGIGSYKEPDLLGRSGGGALDGGHLVVKPYRAQVGD